MIVVAKKLSVLQLFISRMPKMCAILQLVSCLGHRSPLLEKHSKKLTDIPANLYAVLNGRGENKENYCSGSKWCHTCKRKFDKEAGTTDVKQQQQIYFSHFA